MSAFQVFAAACGLSVGFFLAVALIDLIARAHQRWRRMPSPRIHHEITAESWQAAGGDLRKALGYPDRDDAKRPTLRLVR